jgi:hypothetical protein
MERHRSDGTDGEFSGGVSRPYRGRRFLTRTFAAIRFPLVCTHIKLDGASEARRDSHSAISA